MWLDSTCGNHGQGEIGSFSVVRRFLLALLSHMGYHNCTSSETTNACCIPTAGNGC